MGLVTITAPTDLPVSTAELKTQLRIDFADDDALLDRYIEAATDYVQIRSKHQLIDATFEYTIDGFPGSTLFNGTTAVKASPTSPLSTTIQLPKYPVQSITSIKYIDTDGNEQTLSSSLYQLDETHRPCRVSPAYNETWPDTRAQMEAVAIRFVSGHGADETAVPENLKQAVMLLAGAWYENREGLATGNVAREVPFGVNALIGMERIYELP